MKVSLDPSPLDIARLDDSCARGADLLELRFDLGLKASVRLGQPSRAKPNDEEHTQERRRNRIDRQQREPEPTNGRRGDRLGKGREHEQRRLTQDEDVRSKAEGQEMAERQVLEHLTTVAPEQAEP